MESTVIATDFEALRNLTASIQSILVGVALLAGGAWTIFTFSALKMKKKAEAEYKDLQRKIALKPQINIAISGNRVEVKDSSEGYYALATVELENTGTRDTSLHYPETKRPFTVVRIKIALDGTIDLGERIDVAIPYGDGSGDFSRGAIVAAGAKVCLPFAFRVAERGIYLLSFYTYVSVADQKLNEGLHVPATGKLGWTGRQYIVI